MLILIKIAMSAALLLYVFAFVAAKRHFRAHVILAVAGFIIDVTATIGMEMLRQRYGLAFETYSWVLKFHTIVSAIALILFLVQLALGILKMQKWHIIFASYIFLPLWIIAFFSGIYLIF